MILGLFSRKSFLHLPLGSGSCFAGCLSDGGGRGGDHGRRGGGGARCDYPGRTLGGYLLLNVFAFIGTLRLSTEERAAWIEAGYGEWMAALQEESTYHALVTHHGSRALGAQVYKRGLHAAVAATKRVAHDIPSSAAWLDAESDAGRDYWEALQYVARWTRANHEVIHAGFLRGLGLTGPALAFGNGHNFVWRRSDGLYYHGKGATPAWSGVDGRPLPGLIPLNMASPILLCLGAGNEDFLGFAPHGAGRDISRTALRKRFQTKGGKPDRNRIAGAILGIPFSAPWPPVSQAERVVNPLRWKRPRRGHLQAGLCPHPRLNFLQRIALALEPSYFPNAFGHCRIV